VTRHPKALRLTAVINPNPLFRRRRFDTATHEKGIKVSDAEMKTLDIQSMRSILNGTTPSAHDQSLIEATNLAGVLRLDDLAGSFDRAGTRCGSTLRISGTITTETAKHSAIAKKASAKAWTCASRYASSQSFLSAAAWPPHLPAAATRSTSGLFPPGRHPLPLTACGDSGTVRVRGFARYRNSRTRSRPP
jgi:hypothetical protein